MLHARKVFTSSGVPREVAHQPASNNRCLKNNNQQQQQHYHTSTSTNSPGGYQGLIGCPGFILGSRFHPYITRLIFSETQQITRKLQHNKNSKKGSRYPALVKNPPQILQIPYSAVPIYGDNNYPLPIISNIQRWPRGEKLSRQPCLSRGCVILSCPWHNVIPALNPLPLPMHRHQEHGAPLGVPVAAAVVMIGQTSTGRCRNNTTRSSEIQPERPEGGQVCRPNLVEGEHMLQKGAAQIRVSKGCTFKTQGDFSICLVICTKYIRGGAFR